MIEKIVIVPEPLENYDSVYLTVENKIYYEAMLAQSKHFKENFLSVLKISSCDTNNSFKIIVKKNDYMDVVNCFREIEKLIDDILAQSPEQREILCKYGTKVSQSDAVDLLKKIRILGGK